MASPAQLNANRLNAQRSTGPRSEEGKATSRFNALKHGIEARSLVIPGEDPAELEALALDYHNQFQPTGPLESFLVNSLVRADWSRRRYTRIEGGILQAAMARGESATDALTGKPAQLIARFLSAAERLYFRSLKELRRAQKDRRSQEAEEGEALDDPAEPQYRAATNRAATVMERTTPPPSLSAPEIGFVSSDPPQIPARPPALPLMR